VLTAPLALAAGTGSTGGQAACSADARGGEPAARE
jgi:hypothetical protein